ncbi:MAG TPA: hydrogen gas-evolving membrane-bound hydrogenase subunit E [Flavobacterium sp.]|nr:hydrogen gas-evolving membrane-bound hydrogenase subunit E [Flavobacterium sp.]
MGTESVFIKNEWIPSMGISLDFKIDGLSFLFALLITGIGSLIFLYASSYLKKHIYLHRFYCYLMLFMGAMLGVVLSDNLVTLFVFWELTSISSFFLIGFNNEDEESRKSSMWAFSITALGGFFLLAAFVLMGAIGQTFSIQELLTQSSSLVDHSYYYVIIFFLFAGAFTKSAQFPFHFWLPGAMKAPTPVSAYLHSATMVKAGIYLLARFTPVLSDGNVWNTTLMIVGGITMFLGAFTSVFKKDMKSVLAFSTISALGILVFLLGLGTETAIYAACTFVLVHALYKATLFLITGIIDHEAHTRDLSVLSGLKNVMPILAITGFIAALSSAGIPLTFGFLSKELVYNATTENGIWTNEIVIILTILAFTTNVFLTTSGYLVGIKPFFGVLPKKFKNVQLPHLFLWLPTVILSGLTLLFGIMPFIADKALLKSVAINVYGQNIEQNLAIWHGFNMVLYLSLATILLGTLLYFIIKPSDRVEGRLTIFAKVSPQFLMTQIANGIRIFAFGYTRFFQNGYLRLYLMYIILFFIGIVGYKLFADVPLRVNTEQLSAFRAYELVVFVIILATIFIITTTTSRLTAIASLGIVGYCICLIFVFYGAPDLAMTQFAIDTLTVVLFVLVLFKLPTFLKFSNKKIQFRDGVISIAFGILISLITLQALVYPSTKDVSKFYADNAYLLAKGKNVVNVILVDFRGFDTLIETIVLSIAAIGVYGMLKYKLKDGERSE